ncbi:MAG: hypothetical protein QOH06_3896 [Acidobacteriota bacterium]|jgi:hypothetical protein|nr:hypothetical protein [Acidobacteriota bacterium]
MISSLRSAAEPVRVNNTVCFSDAKGEYKKSIEKKQTKLLGFVMPALQPILEPGEEILVVAEGVSPFSVLEYLTTGWLITTLKRCLLVVTNYRILHTATKPSAHPRGSFSEIRYGDVQSLEVKGALGKKLFVSYRDGKKEAFTLMGKGGAKLAALLPQVSRGATPSAHTGRRFLCPSCARPLQVGIYQCSACGQEFKNQSRGRFWSLLAPGGGYFYTGHPILGILDAVTETLLIFVLLFGIFGGMNDGDPEAWTTVPIFAALLAIEKLVTVYHAHHYVNEFLPVGTPELSGHMAPR